MLEWVWAVSVWRGGGGAWPHAPHRLDGARSRLEAEEETLVSGGEGGGESGLERRLRRERGR